MLLSKLLIISLYVDAKQTQTHDVHDNKPREPKNTRIVLLELINAGNTIP